eukprot:g3587.t1
MGLTASKANKDGSITTGGFKFTSIRGDPQYNHYFKMLELGMSMEQVRLLLERDGYKGDEMDDPEAISHLLGKDPVARRKKAWERQRKKRAQQRGSIAEALKAQKGKKDMCGRPLPVVLPPNPSIAKEKEQKKIFLIQEATFEEKRLLELKDKLEKEAAERERQKLLRIKNAHKEIYVAAKLGNLQAVREGFANGGDPNHYVDWFGYNSLRMAESKGYDRIAEYIRHGENKRGRKSVARQEKLDHFLFSATLEGKSKKVEFLLKHGADPNGYCNYWGNSCIHKASRNGHKKILKLLIEHGADIDKIDMATGYSPLHVASVYSRLNCIKVLCQAGAKVNVLDYDGRSPLHYAAELGNVECCNHFILNGCNVKQLDNCERSPADCAYRRGHNDVADFIRLAWNLKTDRGRTHLAMKSWNAVREAKEEGKSESEILAIGKGTTSVGRRRGKLPPRLMEAYYGHAAVAGKH